MGIHHLDLFRYILQSEYESVSGHSFKPPWSLYKSDTGLNLFLKMKNDVAVTYTGTISSRNSIIMQESLIVEGEKGTLVNESQWLEPPLWFYPRGAKERINLTEGLAETSVADQYNISDKWILDNFSDGIMRRGKIICDAADALRSIAALEASKTACETGRTVYVEEFLQS